MKLYDSVELAARNLRESMLRNSLTTVGIGVGVASLVAMLSLGIGLQQLASKRLNRSGLFDMIIVFQQRAEFEGPRRRAPGSAADGRLIDDEARQQIAKISGVVEAFPQIRFASEVHWLAGEQAEAAALAAEKRAPDAPAPTPQLRFGSVAALPMSARETDTFDNLQGRFFSTDSADEAILNSEFAKALSADPAKLIGQEIQLRYASRQQAQEQAQQAAQSAAEGDIVGAFNVVQQQKTLRVVGIAERQPFGGGPMGRSAVFIPQKVAEELGTVQMSDLRSVMRGTGKPTYTSLAVRVAKPDKIQGIEDEIKKLGFGTWSVLDASRNLQRFFAVLDLFLGIFGSLALAVASLGIVNTLVMAILERRREIGIMKAIGASDGDVKGLFFAEAGAMGLLGGMLGVALGWTIGRVINAGTNVYLRRQDLPTETFWSVPWWLVAGALGFALIVSLVSGLYPASRAAKLNPVEALRYE